MPPTALSLLSAAIALAHTTTAAETVPELAAKYGLTVPEYEFHQRMILAHGILMGLAFAVMYPLGAAMIRALRFKGLLWFHAGWQVFAYVLTLGGLGLGLWLVIKQGDIYYENSKGHPVIGLIVIGLIALLPPLGWIHHVVYKSTRARNAWTLMHRWLGRFVLVLGGINGGLGLWMDHDSSHWGIITYSVLAAVFYTLWLVASAWEGVRRGRQEKVAVDEEKKLQESPDCTETVSREG